MLRRLRDYVDELQEKKAAQLDDIISNLANAADKDAVLGAVYKAGIYTGYNIIKEDLEKVLRGEDDEGEKS